MVRDIVYVNIEDKSEELQIDTQNLKVTAQWPLAPCEEPSGLAIDVAHRRLFAGCHNQMMPVVNADSGKVIATPAIGDGVDANAFDPGTGYAFASNGQSATLTVVHEDAPDKFSVVENVATQKGARTMALGPENARGLSGHSGFRSSARSHAGKSASAPDDGARLVRGAGLRQITAAR